MQFHTTMSSCETRTHSVKQHLNHHLGLDADTHRMPHCTTQRRRTFWRLVAERRGAACRAHKGVDGRLRVLYSCGICRKAPVQAGHAEHEALLEERHLRGNHYD